MNDEVNMENNKAVNSLIYFESPKVFHQMCEFTVTKTSGQNVICVLMNGCHAETISMHNEDFADV